jgi:hypothetical protein
MARHLRTKPPIFSVVGLFAVDGGLENVLAADDPDRQVINLDRVDDRATSCPRSRREQAAFRRIGTTSCTKSSRPSWKYGGFTLKPSAA